MGSTTPSGLSGTVRRSGHHSHVPLRQHDQLCAMNGQSYLLNGNDSHALLTSLTKIAGRHTLMAGTDVRLHLINFFNVSIKRRHLQLHPGANTGTESEYCQLHCRQCAWPACCLEQETPARCRLALETNEGLVRGRLCAGQLPPDQCLTLNLGLRYEEESPYTDRHNELNYFSPTVASPARNSSFPNLTGGLVFAGRVEPQPSLQLEYESIWTARWIRLYAFS